MCGHSSFNYIKLLLELNVVWSQDDQKYMMDQIARCSACHSTTRRKPSGKVSLPSLTHHFNDVLCVEHFFTDGIRVFHAMDAQTRYSAGLVCNDF